jgi:hypothetical protein
VHFTRARSRLTATSIDATSGRRERSSSADHVRLKHDHLGGHRALTTVAPTLKIAEIRWASWRSRHVRVVARGRAHLYAYEVFAGRVAALPYLPPLAAARASWRARVYLDIAANFFFQGKINRLLVLDITGGT